MAISQTLIFQLLAGITSEFLNIQHMTLRQAFHINYPLRKSIRQEHNIVSYMNHLFDFEKLTKRSKLRCVENVRSILSLFLVLIDLLDSVEAAIPDPSIIESDRFRFLKSDEF